MEPFLRRRVRVAGSFPLRRIVSIPFILLSFDIEGNIHGVEEGGVERDESADTVPESKRIMSGMAARHFIVMLQALSDVMILIQPTIAGKGV